MTALAGACLAGAVATFGVMWLARPTKVVEHQVTARPIRSATTILATFATESVPTERLAEQLAPQLATLRVERGGTWTTASAIWVDSRGTLATAAPLVTGATQLLVIGSDRASRKARLVGVDQATGVAALVVDRTAGTPISVAHTTLKTGEPAAVVGAPRSEPGQDTGDATVAAVVVRSIGLRASVETLVLHDAVQLDRQLPADAIGGALVDVKGGLLGMVMGNSTERSLATVVDGRTVLATATELRARGAVQRAWLGVHAVDLDPGQAAVLHLPGGAHLTSVTARSPAAAAGLRTGDVITAVGPDAVDDASDLVRLLRAHRPGESTTIKVTRGAASTTIRATLGGT